MSNQTVYQFIAENQNELLHLWTDTLKELSEQESYQLTDQVYENISKEYIDILLSSVKDDSAAESQISELALRAVQIGLSLKFLATALAEFWKRLYTKMNDKRLPDQESTELIWQIDRFFSPINTEIFNQYSIPRLTMV